MLKLTLKDTEIQKIIQEKKTINLLMMYCFFSFKNNNLKFAFAASKFFKKKPIKNHIKRQLRTIVFSIIDWPKDLNIIFIMKKNYYNFSYQEIKKNINIIKDKIKKYKYKHV